MPQARQLAAIMFTDIEGYTALMQQNEEKAIRARDKHRHIFNSTTEKHKGRILQYYGDGTLSIFDSAIDAVKCGIEMQLGFQKKPSIPVRIGIHTGDIIFSEEEIIGDGVNVASRIESLSVPGSVFISEKVYDEIKNQESIQTSMLKKFKLKNVEKPIEVYAISNIGLIVPNSEDIKGTAESFLAPSPDKQDQPKSISEPILATKLYISPPRTKLVLRPRLIEQLNQGIHRKLTLISAAAGFGKTTLVREWVTRLERPIAWLSLDKADNDPIRFLTYLLASLQRIRENIGEGVLAALQSPQPPPIESLVTSIINEITAIPDSFILVLDDYHVVNAEPVNTILSFILDHQPLNMHLAITTREDPDLSLARLRVRDQITELRVIDLRFTNTETAGFLNQVMGLKLTDKDIAALETRTEGWVAGLQLAALSMRGHEDISEFIKTFAGDDRYILDYLVEEVLQSQPETVRSFLLQTSVLDHLSGPLCDALTGQEDGKKMLQSLDRANLFVVPLDDKRHWYRYHHLFAKVLKTRYLEEEPEQVPVLHQRASEWYENNEMPAESIRHSLAAEDFERAAGLIEFAWPAMDRDCLLATWLGWAEELPDKLFRTRPVLILGYVWALLTRGNLEAANDHLLILDQLMVTAADGKEGAEITSDQITILDIEQFQYLPASMANARAYIAQSQGKLEDTVKYAQNALDLLPENAYYERGIPAALMGFAHWVNGDLEATFQSFTDVSSSFRKGGNLSFTIGVSFILADIRLVQGRLREAFSVYEQSLQLAKSLGEPLPVGTEDLYRGLCEIHLEQDHQEAAMEFLRKSEDLGRKTASTDWKYRLRLAQVRLKEVQGDLEGALALLDEAEKLIFRSPLPDFRPVAAWKARVWINQGNLDKVLGWVQEQKLSFDDELSYLNEFKYITLARAIIAQYRAEGEHQIIVQVTKLLNRLLNAAEEGGRMGNVLEILILQAITQEASDNISLGLGFLQRALIIGEKEGYVRIFADEGYPMAKLLKEASAQGIMTDYTNKLIRRIDCANLQE